MITTGAGTGRLGRRMCAFALVLAMALPGEAVAQTRSLFSPPPVPPADIPNVPSPGGSPGLSLQSPGGGVLAPPSAVLSPPTQAAPPPISAPVQMQGAPAAPIQVALAVSARYGRDAPAINNGLSWRIYADRPDASGVPRLIKEEKSAAPTFMLPPGGYVVHVAFGYATAVKPVQLRSETVREVFELPAGGLRLEGRVGDVRIPPGQISFEIFRGSQFEQGDRRSIVQNVVTGDVVLVPEGTYYIVSNYGDGNATVRSDIRVQTGKLTDVTVTHRAAVITLKLVSEQGGEALANTAFSVITPGGDVIKESIGAFPRVILAEGDYRAIARYEGKVYERDFKVITGVDGEVEVVAR